MRFSNGWLVSNTVDESLQRKISQKIFKSKIECPVNAGHYMNIAFHLQPIWLQNLVVIVSELLLTLFPSFRVPPSEVDALLDSNLSRSPFLRQVVDTDLLLCTGFDLENVVLFLCSTFAQRQMNDRKIE